MRENKGGSNNPLDTLGRCAIGSPKSRAAARALLELHSGPPDLRVRFVSFNAVKNMRFDFSRANWNNKEFVRQADEPLAVFEKRVRDSLPVGGDYPKLITWSES